MKFHCIIPIGVQDGKESAVWAFKKTRDYFGLQFVCLVRTGDERSSSDSKTQASWSIILGDQFLDNYRDVVL